MKKQFLILVSMLLLFASNSKAQSWNLTGNTPGATNFLGSTNSQDLHLKTESSQNINFYTNAGSGTFNNQRMIITSGGNVGIDLTGPSRRLDVFDAGNPQLRLTQTAGTNFTDLQTTKGNGLQMYQSDGLVSLFNPGTSPSHIKLAIGTQASAANTWNLTVHSDDRVSVITQYTNFNTGANLTSGFVTGIVSTGDAVIQQNENGRYIGFNTNSGTGTTQRMILTANGDVGIGLPSPLRKLEVLDTGNPQLRLTQTAGTNFTDFQTTPNGDLSINSSNGRVGIATVTPQYTLDVNGTVAAESFILRSANGKLFRISVDDNGKLLAAAVIADAH